MIDLDRPWAIHPVPFRALHTEFADSDISDI